MEPYLVWLVAGFVLVIVELVSGTFYLLVIGVGAFAGSLVAWMGGGYFAQTLSASAVALAGTWAVHRWHGAPRRPESLEDNLLDLGQPVVLEAWVDEGRTIARVKYRGSTWDARMAGEGAARPEPGAMLYINGQDGNTLLVGAAPPAR